ncbi:MAG: response regulator transcription factor [Pirellulaceae bacterium]|nr:response regulator transcription factor [Pirellulaceae bacterium]
MAVRLILVDDQQVIRIGFASLLAGNDIEIIAEAANGLEAIEKTKQLEPDVVLMGVGMPEMDGFDALETIGAEAPGVKVILMSAYENPTYLSRAAALGAADFLWKDAPAEAFVDAIHRAARGEEPPTDSLLRQVRAELQSRPAPSLDGVPLTKREYQVLRHLAQGLSNREIGMSLNMSIGTVKEHTENILRKLDVSDRTEAAVWAVRRGLA